MADIEKEFSNRPFAAGTLTGIRSFRIDHLGRLTGVYYKTAVWKPGENIATCFREPWRDPNATINIPKVSDPYGYASSLTLNWQFFGLNLPTQPKDHEVAMLSCGCGFYAYFDDGPNECHGPNKGQGVIRGIVEGYGLLTAGTRGFRASKSRLRALVVPPKRATDPRFIRVAQLYDVPVFGRRDEAYEQFPLTPAPLPGPDTCDDFWERAS